MSSFTKATLLTPMTQLYALSLSRTLGCEQKRKKVVPSTRDQWTDFSVIQSRVSMAAENWRKQVWRNDKLYFIYLHVVIGVERAGARGLEPHPEICRWGFASPGKVHRAFKNI